MKNKTVPQSQAAPQEVAATETEVLEQAQPTAEAAEDTPEPDEIDDWIGSLGKKAEEPKAEEESEEETEEEGEEEEEETEEEQDTPVLAIEIDGERIEGEEAITERFTTLQAKAKDLETAVAEYQANEAKLLEIIEMVPEFETLVSRLAKGDTLRTALIHAGIGPEDFDVTSEDEPDAESLVQAKLDRKRQIAEAKKAQKEFEENSAKSEKLILDIQKKHGFDDKVKETLIGNMAQFIQDSIKGKLSERAVEAFLNDLNFKSAVERAENAGKIAGKNEKIIVERQKRQGSGVPVLSSGLSQAQKTVKYDDPFTEMIDRAAKQR